VLKVSAYSQVKSVVWSGWSFHQSSPWTSQEAQQYSLLFDRESVRPLGGSLNQLRFDDGMAEVETLIMPLSSILSFLSFLYLLSFIFSCSDYKMVLFAPLVLLLAAMVSPVAILPVTLAIVFRKS